jgi:hypothetical protein
VAPEANEDALFSVMQIVRGVVLILNTKNVVETEDHVWADRLQRARVKSGKAPLLEHTKISIRLSRALAERAGGTAGTGSGMRWHLQRGHFKRIRGQLSPHWRGNPELGLVGQQTRILRP